MRDELIKKLQWNNGGMSLGIAPIGAMFASLFNQKELPSSLVVSCPAEDYTDEELEQLVKFSEDVTAQHKKSVGKVLSSDNLVCVAKVGKEWTVKRLTWDHGVCRPTLDDIRTVIMR